MVPVVALPPAALAEPILELAVLYPNRLAAYLIVKFVLVRGLFCVGTFEAIL